MPRARLALPPLVAALWASAAGGQYLSIEVEGTLPPDLRAALNRVITPSSLEASIAEGARRGVPWQVLCAEQLECNPEERALFGAAEDSEVVGASTEGGGVALPSVRFGDPDLALGSRTFVMLERSDPLVNAYAPNQPQIASAPDQRIAVEISEDALSKLKRWQTLAGPGQSGEAPGPALAIFEHAANPAISKLQEDLDILGSTRRQFRISSDADPGDVEQAVALARGSGVAHVERTRVPVSEFQIEGAGADGDSVAFQADEADCAATGPDWPFDASEVAGVIEHNLRVLERMNVRHLRRSSVLVVDTGLGPALAEDEDFRRFLDLDLGELLFADTIELDRRFDKNSRVCLDVNRWTDEADAFGYAAHDVDTSALDPVHCLTHSPLERVLALSPPPGATLPPYRSEHGSYVAGLALGGPRLVETFPDLDRLLSLSFARITQSSDHSAVTVKTEITTLRRAIAYATSRRVDVLNASIRVENAQSAQQLVSAMREFRGLIVGAAGNFPQALNASTASFPAVLRDTAFEDRMLLVAATRDIAGDRLWPDSARSSTIVNIAAPGAALRSWDGIGGLMCGSGTSAAAPLVSFTAASLMALGMRAPDEVVHRILATAEMDPALSEYVVSGRVLDVATALDIFADHVWIDNAPPRRVHIIQGSGERATMVQACDPLKPGSLSTVRGVLDAAALVHWFREDADPAIPTPDADLVRFWRRKPGSGAPTRKSTPCSLPNGTLAVRDLATGEKVEIPFANIRRIVFSPFRNALSAADALAAEDRRD